MHPEWSYGAGALSSLVADLQIGLIPAPTRESASSTPSSCCSIPSDCYGRPQRLVRQLSHWLRRYPPLSRRSSPRQSQPPSPGPRRLANSPHSHPDLLSKSRSSYHSCQTGLLRPPRASLASDRLAAPF